MDTRREFIKKAGFLSGAAGLFSTLPPSIQRALAINPDAGTSWLDAEHVVILMQENRSFDHSFGSLRGVRGFNDPRAITLPNQRPVWLQSYAAGETYLPFRLDIKNTKATWMQSLPHSWANQVDARNDGKYDQWLNVKKSGNKDYAGMPLTLGFYNREDIPFYYALADAFTVCDQHFCSCLTGTSPNRSYLWTGTIRDHQDESSRALVWNEDMDFESLNWRTFPELLEDSGISWKVYQNEISVGVGFEGEEDPWLSNFTDNNLEFYKQFHVRLHKRHLDFVEKRLTSLPAEIAVLKKQQESLSASDPVFATNQQTLTEKEKELASFQEEIKTHNRAAYENLTAREKSLHQKAFTTNEGDPDFHELAELTYNDHGVERKMLAPKGDVLFQFRQDAKTGSLPAVSWLVAPEHFSDHPSSAWYGAWYVSEVLDILTQNPEVWKKTIFILNYDENDGYFDHVPPFVAPHSHKQGTGKASGGLDTRTDFVTLAQEEERNKFPQNYDRESSIGLGYRVPLVVASPWSRGGYVNSQVFDHTSSIQMIEKWITHKTGRSLRETNISGWRRTVCGDLSSVFRPYQGEKVNQPEFLSRDSVLESIHQAQFKKLPTDYKLLSAEAIEQLSKDVYSSSDMPQQEAGIRPSCALPYQLRVDGQLSADRKSFSIYFESAKEVFGKGSHGAPFHVYAPGKYRSANNPDSFEAVRTWAYAVQAGDQLNDAWPLNDFEHNAYHLRVYGPNGFFREFKGNADDPQLTIYCTDETKPGSAKELTGNLLLHLENNTGHALTVEIRDHAYKTASRKINLPSGSGKKVFQIDLSKSHNWYDFSVLADGLNRFEKRYAGRVETGREGFSDPFMGRVIGS